MTEKPDPTLYGRLTLTLEQLEMARRQTKHRPDCVQGTLRQALLALGPALEAETMSEVVERWIASSRAEEG